ncbi:hypothetical protein DVJ78_02990 [Humibacter sp. BT305]|jgi:hypothetical protein|nr:hypothetical protein DVJ78_02990 [Humibacter sp. BT305]
MSIDIDWGAFVLVFAVALAATVAIVASYSVGLRLLATGADAKHRPAIATAGAFVCFAIGVAAVLYGLYLIIPQFH